MNDQPRQYVAIEFHPADRRSYTYHNDGDPVSIGDRVVVETKKGTQKVTVVGLPTAKPAFETKAILGRAGLVPPMSEPEAPKDGLL